MRESRMTPSNINSYVSTLLEYKLLILKNRREILCLNMRLSQLIEVIRVNYINSNKR